MQKGKILQVSDIFKVVMLSYELNQIGFLVLNEKY